MPALLPCDEGYPGLEGVLTFIGFCAGLISIVCSAEMVLSLFAEGEPLLCVEPPSAVPQRGQKALFCRTDVPHTGQVLLKDG